jgi:hypothetical protein
LNGQYVRNRSAAIDARVEIGFVDRNYRRRKVGQNGAFGLVAALNFYAAVKIII